MRVRKLPRDDDSCGWITTLPPLPPARRVTSASRADCVVLGAGFTGLAVARQLAAHRPEWRVIVLEAQRVGGGASGRNSGFVVDVGHYEAARGVDDNRHLTRLGRAGCDHLRELVTAHGIECAWTARGRLHGAVGDVGMRALEHFRQGLAAMAEPYEPLDAAAMASITGTTYYRAAIRTPGTVMVQPAALVRGLAASLPANVELCEESPVRAIDRGAKFALHIAASGDPTVVADRLFLATNGFTAALGFLRRRVFPMFTFASLTRVLTAEEQAALGGEAEWGLVPEEQMGTTVRRTRDQRILIRNTVSYAADMAVDAAHLRHVRAIHERSFAARFPMLPRVDFEHTWSGVMGITLNRAHAFGKLADNVFAAAGYNGVGVAMGTICGKLLADLAVGADSPLLADALALSGPSWIPPEPLLGIGVRSTLARLAARARGEL